MLVHEFKTWIGGEILRQDKSDKEIPFNETKTGPSKIGLVPREILKKFEELIRQEGTKWYHTETFLERANTQDISQD